jgi:hypothetical protein
MYTGVEGTEAIEKETRFFSNVSVCSVEQQEG